MFDIILKTGGAIFFFMLALLVFAWVWDKWDKVQNYRSAKKLEIDLENARASRNALLKDCERMRSQISELEQSLTEAQRR